MLVRREAEWDRRSHGIPQPIDVARSVLHAAAYFEGPAVLKVGDPKAFLGLQQLFKRARKRHNRFWSEHGCE